MNLQQTPGLAARHPAILSLTIIMLIMAGLIGWHVKIRSDDFLENQTRLAQRSVHSTSVEIGKSIENARHLTQLFAYSHAAQLARLAKLRHDPALRKSMASDIRRFIPQAINFTIADAEGNPLLDDPGKRIGRGCRNDIKGYAHGIKKNTIFIHSNPDPSGYHYDILGEVHQPGAFNGILFVSLNTAILTRLLKHGQMDHHALMLLRADKDNLIDVTTEGTRASLSRSIRLSDDEASRVLSNEPIEGTRWSLVDIPEPGLFKHYRQALALQGAGVWLLFAITSLVMIRMIRNTDQRRVRAEQALREAHRMLETRVEERTRELEASRDALSYHATHDALTGLINRTEFERHLEHLIEDTRAEYSQSVLCYLDLDQFKLVNDTCGHIAGDELLQQSARLLADQVREGDILGRLGGDEFGIIYAGCNLPKACELADRLLKSFKNYSFIWDEHHFDITVSIGIVPVDRHTGNRQSIMSRADLACYTAKDHGRNRYHIDSEDNTEVDERFREMGWATRIPEAIANNRLALYCQPIIENTQPLQALHRFEVLVRMFDNDNGIISPGDFIPAAERYNYIADIERWVIDNSFRLHRELEGRFNNTSGLHFSINLSGHSLRDNTLIEYIDACRVKHGIDTTLITFEITETSAVGNLHFARNFIRRMKLLGFHFALDDFGSGLASFAYLKELPVDVLKIDGQFVRNIVDNDIDRTMVSAIHQVAKIMRIKTTAEFVESEDIANVLRDIGIDYLQGYAFGRPQPAENIQPDADERASV